jgi:signal peptidase I
MGPTARSLAALVGVWVAALLANRSLRRVRGGSMAPSLHAGDLVLTLPVRRPGHGEVVLVRDPRVPTRVQVKRVVGLPGDHVELRGGTRVPPGHVVVLGDARDASTDSRVYGPVPLALVDRRVPLRLSPRPALLRSAPRPLRDAAAPRPPAA